ncbi:hypothetical protein B0T16DRAFT_384533 [Cercophora newfieldiana]|uniref:Transmembrane protein n=1 Tax=Cercophora newfieldiana TaxID=92897 RepID=A0AA39YNC4_9PEZI|nr:hypothetical protein B0T16DRAFT_384533 [Cercophora newfieldiana]
MILFETTESVVEILWDVALAFFVARLAVVYFLLNFLSALALSYLVLSAKTPVAHLVTLQNPEVLLPFLLGSAILWARILVVKCEIPRSGAFRLGVGGVALGLMVAVEAVVAWIGYEEGWWVEAAWKEAKVWAVLGGWLAWYTLIPFVLMFFERREEGEFVPVPVSEVKKEKS